MINETVVLNTKSNKEFFESNDVVALRADKGIIPKAVQEILTELGNPSQAIPYYAIFGPGIDEPIRLEGPITTTQVSTAITKAKGANRKDVVALRKSIIR